MTGRAPTVVVRRNALDALKRRSAEERDAMDFLVRGHDLHSERCIFDEKCSRDYDPLEPPADERLYVGTGIGLLYDLGGEEHAWQLAGWNVRRAA